MLNSLWRSLYDRTFRDDLLWRRLPRPPGVFQVSGDTCEDRFPEIFRFVRDGLDDRTALRLLSFGCSTGEEVFSLRRYFPRAAIDGIDVNPYRIRACRRRMQGENASGLAFSVAGSTGHLPSESYDAIFCLSVLRHGGLSEGPAPRCDHLIQFATAERAIEDFARCLTPGGFLAVANSNFRLADMAVAASFSAAMLEGETKQGRSRTPFYGPDNRLLPGASYREVVFRKCGGVGDPARLTEGC